MIPLDTFNLLREIIAIAAGLRLQQHHRHRVPAAGHRAVADLQPGHATSSPDAALTYAFADGVHPTGGAHAILGEYAVSVLEAPRQIAVLPTLEQR